MGAMYTVCIIVKINGIQAQTHLLPMGEGVVLSVENCTEESSSKRANITFQYGCIMQILISYYIDDTALFCISWGNAYTRGTLYNLGGFRLLERQTGYSYRRGQEGTGR